MEECDTSTTTTLRGVQNKHMAVRRRAAQGVPSEGRRQMQLCHVPIKAQEPRTRETKVKQCRLIGSLWGKALTRISSGGHAKTRQEIVANQLHNIDKESQTTCKMRAASQSLHGGTKHESSSKQQAAEPIAT